MSPPAVVLPALPDFPAGVVGPEAAQSNCDYWLAPPPAGNDGNPGTFDDPWATMEYASETLPDQNCTVWIKDGLYTGRNTIHRRFTNLVTFKAVNPYKAVFEDSGSPLVVRGARNVTFEGMEFRHSDPDASVYVIQVSRKDENWSEHITFRNNLFHDSYNNDLMKIHNGSRYIIVEGNVFYNQGPNEQHLDVNSVTDVFVQDNIFFNDFAGSGRVAPGDTKHFIMIKDSNESEDGLLGAQRIHVRRNIFLNWQGGNETMIKAGNDGKPYHEAIDVLVENNLIIGNSPTPVSAALGVRGAKNVTYAHNTIVGDLPAKVHAMRVNITDLNPKNENIHFLNNIWSDPTGTMGVAEQGDSPEFSDGEPSQTINMILDNNLYWNDGEPIPPGEVLSPLEDDANLLVADPLLRKDQANVVLPRWSGDHFPSGNQTIRQEFERLVELYGQIPAHSPAVGAANPDYAPADDILGRPRSTTPSLGAYEGNIRLSAVADLDTVSLSWEQVEVPGAAEYAINYWAAGGPASSVNVPLSASQYTLTGLLQYTLYHIRLDVLNAVGQVLARSNALIVLTTDIHIAFPLVFLTG